jgi:hypothetical protein
MSDMLDIVLGYIRRNWKAIPVPFKEKGPKLKDWPSLRITEQEAARYFGNGPVNVGVILGEVSDDLVDVDLDCPEAIAAAPSILPTSLCFGRASTRAAHWIYKSAFKGKGGKAVIAFDDPVKSSRLLELRTGAGGKAAQTIFPGSVHTSGETITWDSDPSAPLMTIEANDLVRHVAGLAAATLLIRYWPSKGAQHDTSLALGGMLARGGWDAEQIKRFVSIVVHSAGDPRPGDRVRCALDAAKAVASAQQAYGFPKLKAVLGDAVAGKLADWLGINVSTSAATRGGTVIQITANLTAVAEAGEKAIVAAGLSVYRRDTLLVRPLVLKERDAYGNVIDTIGLHLLNNIAVRGYLDQAARFEKRDGRSKNWVHAKPPADVADLILERVGHWPFPPIRGVLAAPSLRGDGSLLDQPGYDEATGMFLVAPPPMPSIPDQPTWAEGQQAMETLNQLLAGFPFDDDNARAVGLSALVTPVVRAALPTSPLHAITAPEAGTGKSFLTQIAAAIATGTPCPVISAGRNEEETEKRLASVVLSGVTVLAIDNVSQPLGGDFLCQMLDQPRLKIRLLGQSNGPTVEPRMTLLATGNNLTLVGDLVRRAIVAHLDAGVADPWMRNFQGDPLTAVMADRGRYIAAALIAVRAFLVSGEPPLRPSLASFNRWSDWVRSAICAFGYGDAVRTVDTSIADDPDRQEMSALLTVWQRELGDFRYSTAEVVERASERIITGTYVRPALRDALLAVAATKSGTEINPQRLGKWLRSHRDRRLGGLVLRRGWDSYTNHALWAVVKP